MGSGVLYAPCPGTDLLGRILQTCRVEVSESVKQEAFIDGLRSIGAKRPDTLPAHIAPNLLSSILIILQPELQVPFYR